MVSIVYDTMEAVNKLAEVDHDSIKHCFERVNCQRLFWFEDARDGEVHEDLKNYFFIST